MVYFFIHLHIIINDQGESSIVNSGDQNTK